MTSQGVKPRVGMQVWFRYDAVGEHQRISRISGTSLYNSDGVAMTHGLAWDGGGYEIEWEPPTDEERAMFREAARHFGDDWYRTYHVGACGWAIDNFSDGITTGYDVARICESLAMDGL